MMRIIVLLFLLLIGCASSQTASAQTTISGVVSLQDVAAGNMGQPLVFTLAPTGSTPGNPFSQTVTLDPQTGAYTLSAIPAGTYTLGVKGSKWLSRNLPVDTTAGNVTGLTISLLGGDLQGENYVSLSDYLMLCHAYNTQAGDANWNASADLTCDGQVSLSDYLILCSNYGQHGDPLYGTAPPTAPPGLIATPGDNQVLLSWAASPGATEYQVFSSASSGGPYQIIGSTSTTDYTDTTVTNGAPVYCVVTALDSGGESLYSNEASAEPYLVESEDLSAYATGDGKISLYWTQLSGATGYNIYRGTSPGGENYSAPLNGSTPVNTPSYAGSPMDIYSDTGLTNGTEYYYTIEAVYPDGSSVASNEDSDIPSPNAVPWDTRSPGAILSAFRNAFADVEPLISPLRVVGPDGTIYDDAYSTAQPPDGTYDPTSGLFTATDGTTVAIPMEGNNAPNSTSIAVNSITPYASQGASLLPSYGPYRGVYSIRDRLGVSGDITLPSDGNVSINKKNDETAYIYLGMYDQPDGEEADAGLAYSPTYDHWSCFLSVTKSPVLVNTYNGPLFSLRMIFADNGLILYPGDTPTLTFYASTPSNGMTVVSNKLCLLSVDDTLYGGQSAIQYLGAATTVKPKNYDNLQMKRVHAIAQSKRLLNHKKGVYETGSFIQGVDWDNGELMNTIGSWFSWSIPNTKLDGSFDGTGTTSLYGGSGSKANISWTPTPGIPYVQEQNIDINIFPAPSP